MISEEVSFKKIKGLPPNLKQKVIDYVESLQGEAVPAQKRRSLKGLWADLNVNITDEDIREVRNEM